MKKVYLSLLMLISIFALSGSVNAGEHRWGASASYWSTEDASGGFAPEIRFAFALTDNVLLDFRGSYFGDIYDEAANPETEVEVIPLEAGLTLTTDSDDTFDFYATIGGGAYDIEIKDSAINYDAGTEPGFFAAVGTEFIFARDIENLDATKATLVIEAIYRMVSVDGPRDLSDASLNGPGAKIGFLLRW